MQWDRAVGNYRCTTELSGADFGLLPDCVSGFPGILRCTVALPSFIGFFPFAAGRSKDLVVRAWYRKTSTVEWVDTKFVSQTVEVARWCSPRAYVAAKHEMPCVEQNVPVPNRSGMKGGES